MRTEIDISEALLAVNGLDPDVREWARKRLREDTIPDAVVYTALRYSGYGKSEAYLDGTYRQRIKRIEFDLETIHTNEARARGKSYRRGHAISRKKDTK